MAMGTQAKVIECFNISIIEKVLLSSIKPFEFNSKGRD